MRRCTATCKSGDQCRATAASGESVCFAHLPLPQRRKAGWDQKVWTRTEAIANLAQWASMRSGRSPSGREWWEGRNKPSTATIVEMFGGWNAALRAAGLAPNATSPQQYSDAQLLAALRDWANRHDGRSPSMNEWLRCRTGANPCTYKKRFGAWSTAIEMAGLTPRRSGEHDCNALPAARDAGRLKNREMVSAGDAPSGITRALGGRQRYVA